jgi:hypothetical protein
MKKYFLSIYILSFIFNQLCSQSLPLPCNDPLIILAEEKGIKAIPLVDIKRYKKLVKECENLGEKEKIKRLIYNDWQRDYEKAKKMQSWTSTHAMCVFVSFAYYFMGQVLATKPN